MDETSIVTLECPLKGNGYAVSRQFYGQGMG